MAPKLTFYGCSGRGVADHMKTPRLNWLTASGHSFHPVYEVCAICGITRPQYENNGKLRCAGRQSGFERFIEPDDVPDSKGG
jgi:hypothetical protein